MNQKIHIIYKCTLFYGGNLLATYSKFCSYCNQLIPGDSTVCPLCMKEDPFTMRCLKCRNPIQKNWKVCSSCGIKLVAICPKCNKEVPTAIKCENCNETLLMRCKNKKCLEVQVVTKGRKCIKCGKKI